MKSFVASLALAGAANAGLVAPYAGLPLAGLPLAGNLGYAPYYAPGAVRYAAPTIAAPVAYNTAPIAYGTAPVFAAPVAIPHPTPSNQFQTQDEFGNLAYGYQNINSAKVESGNTYTGVSGKYSYVDANGQIQTTHYIADGLGFRVSATNLPVAPVADLKQPIHTLENVKDTYEVVVAKAEFQKAFDEASSREKRSVVLPASTLPLSYGLSPYSAYGHGFGAPAYGYAPQAYGYAPQAYGYAPQAYGYGYAPHAIAAPAVATVAAAPAAYEATLTKIQNNPGFATSYIVQ